MCIVYLSYSNFQPVLHVILSVNTPFLFPTIPFLSFMSSYIVLRPTEFNNDFLFGFGTIYS